MKRRIIAWILAFMMVITAVPAYAEEAVVEHEQVIEQVSESSETGNTEDVQPAAEETQAQEPVEEQPAGETNAEEPSVEQPAEATNADEPSEEQPSEEIPAEEPSGEIPAEEPSEEQPSEEIPAEEPSEEQPSEEIPAEEPSGEQPAEEPSVEEALEEEIAADEPVQPATEEEAQQEDETEEEETPSADDYTLMASEKLSFVTGYAYLTQDNARVYKAENDDEVYAYLSKGVVYAISRGNAGGSIDRIRFAFATEDGVMELYVSASRLRPMSEDEINAFKAEYENGNVSAKHYYNDTYPVDVLDMTLAAVEPETEQPEAEPTPVEPETEQPETEPTPVEPETEQPEAEPTPVEPETEQPETEPTPVEPETEQPEVEPTPVEPDHVEDEKVLAGTATAVEAAETVDLTGTRDEIGVGEKVSIYALVNGAQKAFTYVSDNKNVVTVDANGLMTGVAVGNANITVTAETGEKAVLALSVKNAPSVIVFEQPALVLGEDATHKVVWAYEGDAAGAVEWFSGNELVVSVDKNGVLTANGIGTTAVQARAYNGAIATFAVTVMTEPADIKLTHTEVTIDEGKEMKLGAFFTGDTYGKVTFAVTGGDGEAALTDNGDNTVTVKALKSGTVTVTATVVNTVSGASYSANCVLTIVTAPATIVFENERATIGYKETVYLKPVAYDGRGNLIETAFKYTTSDAKYVSIKGDAVYGAKTGSATVTVTAENGASKSIKITTVNAPSKVTISAPSTTISVGDTVPFSAVFPAGQDGSVSWKVEHSNIAKVDADGNVTALAKGTTRVRVDTFNKKYTTLTIKVTDAPESLSFGKSAYTVSVGCTLDTALTVLPQGASMNVVYALDGNEFVSVDNKGVLTGLKAGTAKLTATVHNYVTDKDIVAECTINVVPGPATIQFKNTRTTIGYKETMNLKPVAYNENGEAVETKFTYTTSKAAYVSLTGDSIYGKSKGTSVITVTAENGVSASVTIQTVNAPSKVTLTADSVNLAVGESTQAHYAFPAGQAGSVSWRVENGSILKIDENGRVTALSKGTTRIRVDSYNKKYALLTIKVVDAPESIAFEKTSYRLGEGESFRPLLTALPEGASTNARYEVVGSDLITVSENGTVTANTTLGTATLRATVHNYLTNKDVVCECQIEVVAAPVSIEFRNLRTVIGYTETVNLEPYALDGRGNEIETTFKLTSGSRYVSIKNGNVYGASKGTAVVTVTAANGCKTQLSIQTVTAPSKVAIKAESVLLSVGDTMQMVASYPAGQTGKVSWTVENGEILSIDANGLVTALAKGATRVRVDTYNKKYATITITVGDAAGSVAFEKSSYQLGEGETMKPVLIASPAGTAANAKYEIVSGGELASVDANGYVTAGTALGTVTLRATVHDHVNNTDAIAECTVEIVPAAVSIGFDNLRSVIGCYETVDLKPYALDGRGNRIDTTFKLASANTGYASIKNGGVYGVRKGTVEITVTAANGVSTKVNITIAAAPGKVTISAPSSKMAVGEKMALTATLPANQAGAVTWKVEDASVLRIDSDGVVTALSEGTTRVRVDTFNKKYALFTVNVYPAPAAVQFAEDEIEITVGMKIAPELKLSPANAYVTPVFAFAKEGEGEDAVTVDGANIIGNHVGAGILTVSYTSPDGVYMFDTQRVVVKPAPKTIELNAERYEIGLYETIRLNPVAYDEDGNEVNTTFTVKSSSTGYIQIKNGGLYGARRGSAKITVTAHNGVSVTETFKVVSAPSKVTVKADDAVISQTGSTRVRASFANGQIGKVTWISSDDKIATVDSNGVVIAKAVGTVSFKATSYNGKYAVCTIEVKAEPTGIAFEVDEARVGEDGNKTIKAVLPANCAGSITYSSANPYVAVVNPTSGVVTGMRQGTTIITATTINNLTGESFSDSYVLTVTPKPVKVVLGIGRDKIGYKETASLEAVAYDEFGNVTEGGFTFASSRTGYVKINDKGEIYGAGRSYSDITVTTYNGIVVKQRFTTVSAPTSIKFNKTSVTMSEMDTVTLLTATSNGSASGLTWETSDDKVVTVDEKGNVKAVAFGKAVITVSTFNDKKASCEVVVKYEPSRVDFENDAEKVGEGNSRVIAAAIPEDCFGSITYTSSDPETVSVDSATGKVVGLKGGKVTITASVTNRKTGETFKDTYELTVTPKPVKIEIHAARTKIGVGEIMSLEAVAYDANGQITDGGFTYASSRTYYVKVNEAGEVYGVRAGYSDITVKTYNGVSIKGRITVVKAPTSVAINKSEIRISEIDTYQLAMQLSNGSIGAYTWTSSDENVAVVDQNGLVTAKGFGTADIVVTTYNGKAATCKVKVCYEPETISFPDGDITVGELASATVKAELGDDYIGKIEYISGNDAIATIDADTGVITGVLAGETTVIAKTVNRKTGKEITAAVKVVVTPAPARVEIQTGITTIGYKEKIKIEAVTYDAAGNIIDGQLKLATSNSRYVQVNSMMEIYGANRGSATIGVIAYNGVFSSVKITVKSAPGSVNLDKTAVDVIIGNEPVQLNAALPSGTASQITWASENDAIAKVDENGVIIPVAYGTTRIRASAFNGKYKLCTVNVFEAPQSVAFSESEISVGVGQSYVLKATVNEKAASPITFKSSNDSVATIDANGKVTAIKEGNAKVTATTFNGKTDTCNVVVKKAPSKVEFTISSLTIGVKQDVNVSHLVKLPEGSAASFTYAVEKTAIAKINASGVLTGVKVGTTRVKVTAHNGQYALLNVEVKSAPSTLTLIIGNSKLYTGESSEYSVSLPGGIVTEYVITSSDPEIVRVDSENHRLIAVSKGKATITAQAYNGVIKTAVVEVLKHVETITLDKSELSLVHHDTFQLTANVLPEDASDKSVIWVSSDPEKVSVSADGLVTALQVTTAPVTITARTKDLNLSATCKVSVTPVRVTGIKLDLKEYTLEKNRMVQLFVTVSPDNADDETLRWESGDKNLATVSENGLVTAVGHEGTVKITVTSNDGGFTDECVITLSRIAMRGMALSEPSVTLVHYTTGQIVPEFTPRDAEYQSITYESLNPETVKVSQTGLMEAVNVGTGKINVTVTDYFGTVYTQQCTVAVVPVPVSSIELSASELEIRAGKTENVTVVVLPDNAFNKQVKWESSNEDAATVTVDPTDNHKATINAISGGEAVITVTALDNGLTDTVKVDVFDALDATLTANHAANTVGNTISWTAEALNAIGNASFKFTVVKDGASTPLVNITDFTSKNVVSVENAAAGTYTATVTVKDGLNDTCTKTATIVVSESILFVNGSDTYTYVILPGAAADGGDGAAIKYQDPSAAPSKVVIPALVNGVPVVRVDTEAFLNATKLVTVSVPETVTVIGARAFKGCTALSSMTSHTAG